MTREKRDEELYKMLNEARAFLDSRQLVTNEGRTIVTMIVRLMETMTDGKPRTELPARHHA